MNNKELRDLSMIGMNINERLLARQELEKMDITPREGYVSSGSFIEAVANNEILLAKKGPRSFEFTGVWIVVFEDDTSDHIYRLLLKHHEICSLENALCIKPYIPTKQELYHIKLLDDKLENPCICSLSNSIKWVCELFDLDNNCYTKLDYSKVIDLLEKEGYYREEFGHVPYISKGPPSIRGRYIIGKALESLYTCGNIHRMIALWGREWLQETDKL